MMFGVVAQIGAREGGASHWQPVVWERGGRASDAQNNALQRVCSRASVILSVFGFEWLSQLV
jgi:hypothetical protein